MKQYQGLQFEEVLQKIAALTAFSKGKQLVLDTEVLFRPLIIQRECNRSKEALDCTIRYGSLPFDGIRDIEDILKQALRDGICSPMDLLYVCDHERGLASMLNYMKKVEFETEGLNELMNSLVSHPKITEAIEKCISSYGEVLDNASPKLSSIRKRMKSIDADLSREAAKFINANSSKLMDTIVTTRNNRVVVLAKMSEKNSLGGFIHGESASGQTTYVEPACLVNLNNEKQMLQSQHNEEVERILFECSQIVKGGAEHYIANLETMALLDGIFAKARYGKEVDGIIANLTDRKELNFIKARHPFIDPKHVVANTYRLSDKTKLLLITGPNTGGKTVSLKVIGLFVLMTYAGIPIPCEEADVCMFDELYLDITDDQSIEQSLSTFSAHISKLAHITSNVTEKSLVLLDEIGSGTDPKEGESLAIAVLNELRKKGCISVATTHYGRLKTYGKKHEDILLASVQFDVEKMTPTFKYIEGLTGQSNAFVIARKFGLKESILKEAEFLKSQQRSSEDELIEKLESQVLKNNQLEFELTQKLNEISELEKKLTQEKETLQMQKENLMDKAKLEAQEYVEDVKLQAEIYFEELKQKSEVKIHEYNDFKKQLNTLDEVEEEEEIVEDFEVGNTVSIKNSNQIGKIISLNKDKAIIDVSGMKITTKVDQLRHRKIAVQKEKPAKRYIDHVKPKISMECNLIGMRVEEALNVYDKYMDDAILSGLPSVRIIHGVGTGALRLAIHERLKKRKDIEFRMGGQGEGGVGATVVTFLSRKSS